MSALGERGVVLKGAGDYMYARATWFEGPADQVEARVTEYPHRMQSIKEAPGCTGIAALVNREAQARAREFG